MRDAIAEIIRSARETYHKAMSAGDLRPVEIFTDQYFTDQILDLPAEGWILTTCKHYRGCENEALSCQKYVDGDTSCMRPATFREVLDNKAVKS